MNLLIGNRILRFLLALPLFMLTACASQPGKDNDENVERATSGATDLSFRDFYKMPVGPKGLEPTEKLLSLKGQRVQVRGHVVKEEEPYPGLFLLTPVPMAMAERADGPADYLPAATLFVHMPEPHADKAVVYQPGLWAVTGTLELGGLNEVNGRVSYVRLQIDDISAAKTPTNQVPQLQDTHDIVSHHPY